MKMNRVFLIICAFLIAAFAACGGGNLNTPGPQPGQQNKARDLTESGWVQYSLGNYDSAIRLFNDAKKADAQYLDSYNGLGWSYFRAHNLILSLFNFRIPYDADSSLTDVYVGYSIAAFEQNEYEETITSILHITNADSVKFDLEGTDEYFFTRDTDVTSREVRKILALSYFFNGQFAEAYYQLITFLDPLNDDVDPGAENFQSKLLEALEEI